MHNIHKILPKKRMVLILIKKINSMSGYFTMLSLTLEKCARASHRKIIQCFIVLDLQGSANKLLHLLPICALSHLYIV
jgi:hypothetical protein